MSLKEQVISPHPINIEAQFNRAVDIVQGLPKAGPIQSTYDEKLAMYSLYKQATEGNVKISRPGMFDMLGRAKWDAWESRKDIEKEEAKSAYVEVLLKVLRKYSDRPQAEGFIQELLSYSAGDRTSGTWRRRRGSATSNSSQTSGSSFHDTQEEAEDEEEPQQRRREQPFQPQPDHQHPQHPDPTLPPPDIPASLLPMRYPSANEAIRPLPLHTPVLGMPFQVDTGGGQGQQYSHAGSSRGDHQQHVSTPYLERRDSSSSIEVGADAASHRAASRPASLSGRSKGKGRATGGVPLLSAIDAGVGGVAGPLQFNHPRAASEQGARTQPFTGQQPGHRLPHQIDSNPAIVGSSIARLRTPNSFPRIPESSPAQQSIAYGRIPHHTPIGTPQFDYRGRLSPASSFNLPPQRIRQALHPGITGFQTGPGSVEQVDVSLALQQIQTSLTALHERISSLEHAQTLILTQPTDPFTALVQLFFPSYSASSTPGLTRFRQDRGNRLRPTRSIPVRLLFRILGTIRRLLVDTIFVLVMASLASGVYAGIRGRGRGGRTAVLRFWRTVIESGRRLARGVGSGN